LGKTLKAILLASLAMVLLLVGCDVKAPQNTETGKVDSDSLTSEEKKEASGDVIGDIASDEVRDTLDKPLLEQNGDEKLKSKPEISPGGTLSAFIKPFAFETVGEAYIYDASKKMETKVDLSGLVKKDHSVKQVKWLSDRYLLIGVGYTYGTVAMMSEVYAHDTKILDEHLVFRETDKNKQIKSIDVVCGKIVLEIATFDNNMNEYSTTKRTLSDKDMLYDFK
jgi:hypothetical protein